MYCYRIIGSGEFVERVLAQADQKIKEQFSGRGREQKVAQIIKSICKQEKVKHTELKTGGRRGKISRIRSKIIHVLVQEHGIPMALVAQEVGVMTAAVSMCLSRGANE